jgi:hypothetical protein
MRILELVDTEHHPSGWYALGLAAILDLGPI